MCNMPTGEAGTANNALERVHLTGVEPSPYVIQIPLRAL